VNNNADRRSIEVHLFDFSRNIYGKQIDLCFFRKIREEQKFDSIEALKNQLEQDKLQVLSLFSGIHI
jgi:riboflavin kinase/FMN adenylyltransferase